MSINTPGRGVDFSVDITGAESLILIAKDGNDGFGCDWADWLNLQLSNPTSGETAKLTSLKWKSATSGFGEARVGTNCVGDPLSVAGEKFEDGIGTHANSVIVFDLPAGHDFTTFSGRGALDDAGTNQGCGSTVEFIVFTQTLDEETLRGYLATTIAPQYDLERSVSLLKANPQLSLQLFASEPMVLNPSSIDVDHLGRVWVCEGTQYRPFANQDVIPSEAKGDRIVILTDKDGDGVADQSQVFYQGTDVNAAHGILVLPTLEGPGTRALISMPDRMFFLIDDDGDLKADRKELLFLGSEGIDHDHGIHGAQIGPDGKLYFNFGNENKVLRDKNGNVIVDRSGREIKAERKPYQEGMLFRCDLDGSNVETLGWNFRNNWEACVDSFGSIWQSDNDDDGNRATRVNFILERGNYGFTNELTGAGWRTGRTNLELEVPLQHWHQNDPGVVPNLLITGAGAPTGICFYEGIKLPATLRNSFFLADPGTNSVKAYVPKPAGAGYTAETVDLLTSGQDPWFRPSDVCIAPDGSILISDWYDPGVGGHRMQDASHGRIFRLSNSEPTQEKPPALDLKSIGGLITALQSPNQTTRYLAMTLLRERGAEAEEALTPLLNSQDPVLNARAMWLMCALHVNHDRALNALKAALSSQNPNLRIAGLRALRQNFDKFSHDEVASSMKADDISPAVRREMLIALHDVPAQWIPDNQRDLYLGKAWAKLAQKYDGKDRWYLEAVGIAADGHWEEWLPILQTEMGTDMKNLKAGRDIVWRSRSHQTPGLLAELISSPVTPDDEVLAMLRAFDFQKPGDSTDALLQLASSSLPHREKLAEVIQMEALNRLDPNQISTPELRQTVIRLLDQIQGSRESLLLIGRLKIDDRLPQVLSLIIQQPESQYAVDGIRLLFQQQQSELIKEALKNPDRLAVEALFTALATAGDQRATPLLLEILNDSNQEVWMRQGSIRSLAGINAGAELLKIAQANEAPDILRPAFAASLTTSSNPEIRQQALGMYPQPPTRDAEPLPPVSELIAREGDSANGRILFNTTGTCNRCHQVNGIGLELGPNLSEIGKKLAKQSLYESVLFPSAAISHGYENWIVSTEDGQIYLGLLISRTDEEVKIRDDKGIERTIPAAEVEMIRKTDISMMPADLQSLMTVQELVDVVEYMTTLQERKR